MLEAIATSFAVVALAEIGDKTMLLAIVLAARFRKPVPIVGGILFATLANHAVASFAGAEAAAWFDGYWFRLAVALGFVAMGLWTLVPDKFDDDDAPAVTARGAFLTTLVAFFIVEMGDKTQLATVALGAQFHNVVLVAAGTTLGMMIANMPAVLLGDALVRRVSLKAVRIAAAALFVAVGVWMLAEAL